MYECRLEVVLKQWKTLRLSSETPCSRQIHRAFDGKRVENDENRADLHRNYRALGKYGPHSTENDSKSLENAPIPIETVTFSADTPRLP
jgi:glucose-6-phosphate isomerase